MHHNFVTAVRALSCLITHPQESFTAKKLAKTLETHPRHFEAILQKMVKYGWITGKRGPKGGYTLRQNPCLGEMYYKLVPMSDFVVIQGVERLIIKALTDEHIDR